MKKWDVVIIGSGISSLTCAALLSKKGKSVCVLEQHTKPGGYLHCFSRFRQRYDTGAHYVGAMDQGQPFHTLLSYLGVYDDSLFLPLDPEGFDVFRFKSFELQIPKGYSNLIERLSSRFPSEREAIQTFFALVQDVANHF
ncbi:MAG TPA: FAD-dependent oxidoreductase, partial [Bdellovibrionales bacterium]|nr:FAD-dependent oxidoreductase [Bdellovibrionales bacterium]